MDLSSQRGLEGLTIGALAKQAKMSKSGLYAHFASKEALQIAVLDRAASHWVDEVLAPALKAARGLPRIEALFEGWLRWETAVLSGGCLFVTAATEFDDRDGPVRHKVAAHLQDMLGALARAASIATEVGHFRSDLDTDQFAYELWGILVVYQHYLRLLKSTTAETKARIAFAALVARAEEID